MKHLPTLLAAILVVSLALAPTPVLAAGKAKKKEFVHHYVTISAVSANSITVTNGKQTRTYKIDDTTSITVRGQRATATDLTKGLRADITADMDAGTASVITASDVPMRSVHH